MIYITKKIDLRLRWLEYKHLYQEYYPNWSKWSRWNEKSLGLTIDITSELVNSEPGYNNFFYEFNNEKINLKMLGDLTDNYLKIRKNIPQQVLEELKFFK